MTIKDVCLTFSDGDWIESKDQSDCGIRLIQTGNIGNGEYLDKPDRAKYISEETYSRLNCTEVFPGDILVSRLPDPIGRACIIPESSERMITAVDCTICRPDEDKILKEYLCYYMQSTAYYSRLMNSVTGTTRKRISRSNLGSVEVPVPDKSTQKNVVEKLDRLMTIIRARKEELEKLDNLIKARFVELFGDMILNPNGWDKYQLGEVCDVRDGTHDSPQYYSEGYPLVTSKNVTGGRIDLAGCSLICEDDYQKINQRSKVDYGDILMPMIGTVGNPVIVNLNPEFAIKNVALIKLKKESKVLNTFVKALLESEYFDNAVLSKIRGGTQKFISLGDIRKLEICLPPIDVQDDFENFVKQVDKSKSVVQKSLDETQLLFDSLMQQYFG